MLPTIPILEQPHIEPIQLVIKEEKKEPKKHIVQKGDTLTSISSHFNVPISRLWAANPQLTSPDLIEPNQQLNVPENTDVLTERAMSSTIDNVKTVLMAFGEQTSAPRGRSSVSGNTYYWGQCVWYIKNVVSWVENGWGNGNQWVYTSGHSVSSTPAVGTVASARSYNHVALVTAVGNGTVTISEMNYEGLGVISSRTAPVSEFQYIYP